MHNRQTIGHILAALTVFVWGMTFISTKILLHVFTPVEILFIRFVLGLCALFLACPHRLKGTTKKQEGMLAAAGLCGICLYYLLENIALTYTLASNVGVIVATAPFFTAMLAHFCFREKDVLHANFFVGFLIAMLGIGMISFNGAALHLNPIGDVLALLASLVWACYSNLTRKIGTFGYPTVLITRRIFLYGTLFMLPTLFFFDCKWDLMQLTHPVYLANILFLGLGASALCFVTWNFAVKLLGAVKTSVYIYMTPVVTAVTSVLILHETITPLAGVGIILILTGLILSEWRR